MRRLLLNIYTLYFNLCFAFHKNIKSKKSNFIFVSLKMYGINKAEFIDSYISKSSIYINGNNNIIKTEGEVYCCNIKIIGDNNICIIDKNSKMYNTNLIIRGNGCVFSLGKCSTIGSAHLVCMGKDNELTIGEQCMISDNVNMWNSDSHPIIDKQSSEIINPSSPINIGNHVWVGKNCTILKGAIVNDGAVIGMNSLVKGCLDSDAVYAGNPIKCIKTGISWDRHYITK